MPLFEKRRAFDSSPSLFRDPRGLVSDNNGNLYISTGDIIYGIWKLNLSDGTFETYTGSTRGDKDGPINEAQFNSPTAMCFDTWDNQIIQVLSEKLK